MALYMGKDKIDNISVSFRSPDGGTNTSDATLNSGSQMLSGVTAYSNGVKYTGNIPYKHNADIAIVGKTVNIPAGYYQESSSKSVSETSVATPSVNISSSGLVTASNSQTTGYVVGKTTSNTLQLNTQGAKTVVPSASEQVVVNAGVYTTGDIKVAAVENSPIVNGELLTPTINNSTGLVTSGVKTSGYLSQGETTTLQLPVQASKTIVPKSTSQTAVASGVFTTGNVTVSAVQTESKNITSNGTYTPTSGKYFSSVSVNVAGDDVVLQDKAVSPIESNQTVYADSGYDGLSSVTVGAISSNYVGSAIPRKSAEIITPSTASKIAVSKNTYTTEDITVAAMPNGVLGTPTVNTSGLVTATVTTSGYIPTSSIKTLQLTTKGASTITPGVSDQTISSGRYLTGNQTIKGDANLVSSNIISGKSIFGVSGNVVIQKYYTGSTTPSNSFGNDGDLYLKI